METLIQLLLAGMAIFIILLVLVQRGRGGGLVGALGGPGGSSAFGAKAGDTFTKITIWSAAIWILLCVGSTYWAGNRGDAFGEDAANFAAGAGAAQNETIGAGEAAAADEAAGAAGEAAEAPAEESAE